MSIAQRGREIHEGWEAACHKARMPHALGALPGGSVRLLGSSKKVALGEAYGWKTKVLYMAPAREAFTSPGDTRTLCPFAGTCAAVCLGHNSGQMIMSPSRRARLWKTALYVGDRTLWRELLLQEASAFDKPGHAIRVDGTSDTGEGALLAKQLRYAEVYDYTKSMSRAMRSVLDCGPHHHTYSVSELSTLALVDRLLWKGGNAAVVFATKRGEALPKSWRGHEVVDGDAHDLRFLDGPGKVAGLRFKASKAPAESLRRGIKGGFVFPAEES